MKNIKHISKLGLVAVFFALFSCTEDEIGSRVTNYAVFDYEPVVAIALGEEFVPDGTATEGGEPTPVTITNNVDNTTVGVYTVTYSAINSDGFPASATQTVVVHDPNIVGTDVSGNIRDTGNNTRTGVISLVEGTTSIFYVTDFGFAGAFPIYFQMDGDTISEIPQQYPLDQTSVDLAYNSVSEIFTVTISPAGFSYTFEYY